MALLSEVVGEKLKPYGLWISWKSKFVFKVVGCSVRFLLIDLFLFLLLMYLPYITDILDFAISTSKLSTYIAFSAKAINVNCHVRDIKNLNQLITKELENFNQDAKFKNRIARVEKILNLFTFAAVTSSSAMGITPLFTHTLANRMWFPFDTKNPINFWIAASYQFFAMVVGCRVDVMLEMIPVLYMIYVIAMLEQLCEKLENLKFSESGDKALNNFKEMSSQSDIKTRKKLKLIKLMKSHQKLLEITHEIQKIFSFVFFIRIFMTTLVMCTSVYSVSMFEESSFFISFLMYAIATSAQLSIPCYFANEISVISDRLSTSLFHSQWYAEEDKEYRKIVSMSMEVLRNKIKITSAKVFEVNLETFLKVCNKSYALYAVFNSFKN